jgi:nicotinamide mononucleotide transporter
MSGIWQSVVEAARAMSWVEITAVFFGILQVILSSKVSVWTYPAGIISVILFIYLCWAVGLYAEAFLQLFYFVMSIYGWYYWVVKKEKDQADLRISSCTGSQHLLFAVITVVIWLPIYFVLARFTNSDVPFVDSFTTALFFVGMILMALKKIENWIYLIAGDIICVPLWWYKESYLVSIQFIVFTGIATWGYFEWRKKLRSERLS